MTFDDCRKLQLQSRVQLSNGRIGRIASWHHGSASIGVRVLGESVFRLVTCASMAIDAAGNVVVSAPGWAAATPPA